LAKLVKKAPEADTEFLPVTRRVASLAYDLKARDIKAYDVRGMTLIADSFLMCSASSEPQMKAVFNAVREGMKEVGVVPLHSEGRPSDGWMVLDYGIVIAHLFREDAREFYDLDGLWADAPLIELDLDD
jgi:ribosome-associated protein